MDFGVKLELIILLFVTSSDRSLLLLLDLWSVLRSRFLFLLSLFNVFLSGRMDLVVLFHH